MNHPKEIKGPLLQPTHSHVLIYGRTAYQGWGTSHYDILSCRFVNWQFLTCWLFPLIQGSPTSRSQAGTGPRAAWEEMHVLIRCSQPLRHWLVPVTDVPDVWVESWGHVKKAAWTIRAYMTRMWSNKIISHFKLFAVIPTNDHIA